MYKVTPSPSKSCAHCGGTINLKICTKCRKYRYCSREHQVLHFKWHKDVCNEIATQDYITRPDLNKKTPYLELADAYLSECLPSQHPQLVNYGKIGIGIEAGIFNDVEGSVINRLINRIFYVGPLYWHDSSIKDFINRFIEVLYQITSNANIHNYRPEDFIFRSMDKYVGSALWDHEDHKDQIQSKENMAAFKNLIICFIETELFGHHHFPLLPFNRFILDISTIEALSRCTEKPEIRVSILTDAFETCRRDRRREIINALCPASQLLSPSPSPSLSPPSSPSSSSSPSSPSLLIRTKKLFIPMVLVNIVISYDRVLNISIYDL